MGFRLTEQECRNFDLSSRREWMLADGSGGYAMGTASGANTRRYHGHLVAVTGASLERYVLLANVEAAVEVQGRLIELSTNQYPGVVHPHGYLQLKEFEVSDVARWRYSAGEATIEKTLALGSQSTVTYKNVGNVAVGLMLRPLVQHKFYHGNFRAFDGYPERLEEEPDRLLFNHFGIPLHLSHPGAERTMLRTWYYRIEHLREFERGLDPIDDLFCPCELRYELKPGDEATLSAWTDVVGVPAPSPRHPLAYSQHSLGKALAEATSAFLIKTPTRTSVIAGYPWFTDWGRDTMIALPGLCLHTGRHEVAKQILLDYMAQMRNGLIPNRFAEGATEPEYNTADATLWMAHAAYKTLHAAWDEELAQASHQALAEMIDWHRAGTLFGIRMDPADGLLVQGEEGLQLTWMDARVGDEVITPRHGKAVEINGLWINALRIKAWLAGKLGRDCEEEKDLAIQAQDSFEKKFWSDEHGHYLDLAEPEDAALRPNQVIAMSLPFVQLDEDRARNALSAVGRELLTPRGLRTLSSGDPKYRGRFSGSLPELDRSYHQGTVWPWLLGPYVTALVRYTGDRRQAKRVLRYAKEMLQDFGLGGIAEVYDGDPPHTPAGCPWQAWSVAEIHRAWVEDVGGD